MKNETWQKAKERELSNLKKWTVKPVWPLINKFAVERYAKMPKGTINNWQSIGRTIDDKHMKNFIPTLQILGYPSLYDWNFVTK